MEWENIVKRVTPYIVRIETPDGGGTGFFCGYNEDRTFCLVATALHVVDNCNEWQQPLRVRGSDFNQQVFLKEGDRVIFTDQSTDSAVIAFQFGELDFPEDLIRFRSIKSPIDIGAGVGWLGYPGIASGNLCFFSGSVSARLEERKAYLIDGVAINGVSGGPVMYATNASGVEFVGIVSAYRPNRLTGDTLPGLLIAQDVSHFHDVIQTVKSLDEAREKKPKIEADEETQR
jgi:hypothetical protein